jgi:hypothetical protein
VLKIRTIHNIVVNRQHITNRDNNSEQAIRQDPPHKNNNAKRKGGGAKDAERHNDVEDILAF